MHGVYYSRNTRHIHTNHTAVNIHLSRDICTTDTKFSTVVYSCSVHMTQLYRLYSSAISL
jgi:hypothetical protein